MMEFIVSVLAFFAAAVGSVLGVGGGFIFIPVTTNVFAVPPNVAVPASLSMVLANAVSATWTRAAKNALKLRSNLWLGLAAVPSAVLGSYVGVRLEVELFKLVFGFFLASAAFLVWMVGKAGPSSGSLEERPFTVGLTVVTAGFLSALLGLGGGLLMVPAFLIWCRLGPHEAVGTSQFVTAFNAATGIVSYMSLGFFNPVLFATAVAGGFLGGLVGSRIELGLPETTLRQVIVVGFLLIGFWMILSTALN
ncbi:MAG: sulfite exporter TauE/SafE family protein [Candidatus Caldarchaeum sp.]|nr:sulfite exporter TauE/SafE family protein [Candidatus Caldarchaeum sp.]